MLLINLLLISVGRALPHPRMAILCSLGYFGQTYHGHHVAFTLASRFRDSWETAFVALPWMVECRITFQPRSLSRLIPCLGAGYRQIHLPVQTNRPLKYRKF
jgi:hypothetical protein